MTTEAQPELHPDPREALSAELFRVIDTLVHELHPGSGTRVAPESSLERDLGLDSLARVELLARIEQHFKVRLPEETLGTVQTVSDILAALGGAGASSLAAGGRTDTLAVPQKVEGVPSGAATLLEALAWQVEAHAEREHVVFYRSDESTQSMSYAGLVAEALAVAAGLKERGLQPGQAVAIMLPSCLEFFHCFYGILAAGGIPVPLYPPARLSQLEDHLRRQSGILRNCLAPILITVPEAKLLGRFLEAQVETLHSVVTVQELHRPGTAMEMHPARPDDIAFIQYTSGSTGNPKSVVLTHANLLANIRAWGRAVRLESTDVVVSWLPLYHDMGLIGTWLGSVYHACPLVLMSPLDFLSRPERWLWAIHRHRGTATAAPNFAYELCARRLSDEQLQGLDLSSWRVAANGAEPVSPATIAHFTGRFGRYGFRPETMMPVYGLAECTVGLAIPPLGRQPVVDRVQREPFIETGRAIPAVEGEADALSFVACGVPLPGHQVRIVDEAGRELPDRSVGRLEFRGPSACSGYYRNEEDTNKLIHGEWLDSGDLAYVAEGDIYLSSRAKDMIIRGGRNIYPYELEEAVGDLEGIRKGCVAIFGVADAQSGTERLVIVAETRLSDAAAREALQHRITALAVDRVGSPPDEVVLAPPQTVLKTSSGKIRRSATREIYLEGAIGAAARAPWLQMIRVAGVSLRPFVRRRRRAIFDWVHALRVWALFGILAPSAWIAAALVPRPEWAWAVSRAHARLLFRLSGAPVSVTGLEHLPAGASVAVGNHASYLDGVVLVAALARPLRFVAKRELRDAFIPRVFLNSIGTEFVERFDVEGSLHDAGRLEDRAHAGESLFFFAEGTLTREPGLKPFHMGAFQVAAEAGLPIVAVTLAGTRSVLRDGTYFPRRGAIRVTISPPIAPQGKDWAAALRLRDAVRAEILRHCGEPDLSR